MNDAGLRSVRHEVWADLELLRFCEKLTPEQLGWTVLGTSHGVAAPDLDVWAYGTTIGEVSSP